MTKTKRQIDDEVELHGHPAVTCGDQIEVCIGDELVQSRVRDIHTWGIPSVTALVPVRVCWDRDAGRWFPMVLT